MLVNLWWVSLCARFHCPGGEAWSHSHVDEWIFGSRIQSHWPCSTLCPISMLSRILASERPAVPRTQPVRRLAATQQDGPAAQLEAAAARVMTRRMYAASLAPRLSSTRCRSASSSRLDVRDLVSGQVRSGTSAVSGTRGSPFLRCATDKGASEGQGDSSSMPRTRPRAAGIAPADAGITTSGFPARPRRGAQSGPCSSTSPANYIWNLGVAATLNSGGAIDEVDRACRPIREAPDVDSGSKIFMQAWKAVADQVAEQARASEAAGHLRTAGQQ